VPLDPIHIGFWLAALGLPLLHFADPEVAEAEPRHVYRSVLLMPVLAFLASLDSLQGLLGGLLAAAYGLGAAFFGWRALGRALCRPVLLWAEVGLAAAWIWVIGGGVWLFVAASGTRLLGFGGIWALLTAAHFHAAGFGAVAVSALLARVLGRRQLAILALHPVAFALVAIGLTGHRWMEQAGTVIYLILFGGQLALALSAGAHRQASGQLLLAALAVPLATLALAADWALGGRHLTLEQMAWLHGTVNAAGHGLLGIVALRGHHAAIPPLKAPISNVYGGLTIGPGLVTALNPPDPESHRGLTANFAAYIRPDWPEVDDRIVHFYEHTADYDLAATQDWQRGFKLGGRLFAKLAQRVGQLGLPGPGVPAGAMTSALLDIDDTKDGRTSVRAWVRTWRKTGNTLYVALYSEHTQNEVRTMNIAFPLPYSNMTSILHLQPRADGGGLTLTSLQSPGNSGNQGVYLRLENTRPWRLPLDETIEVNPEQDHLSATHQMWIFGHHFLTLRYIMQLRVKQTSTTSTR
jgi:hypothetical protein